MLRPEQLVLVTATFQIAYAESVLMWDRAGTLWHKLRRQWPELQLGDDISPARVSGQLASRFAFQTELNKATLTDHGARSLGEVSEAADAFGAIVCDTLELESLERVSARLIWHHNTKSLEEAVRLVAETGIVKTPQLPTPTAVLDRCSASVAWSDAGVRSVLRLNGDQRKVEWQPMAVLYDVLRPVRHLSSYVLVDFECSAGPIARGQLSPSRWINRTHNDGAKAFSAWLMRGGPK